MTWLVWKDFRLNRLIFIVAAVLFVLPYVIPAFVFWYRMGVFIPKDERLLRDLIGSSFQSVILLQLTMAFVGGNAIACERADRSAEFLAYLPVSRGRIVASKLLMVLGLVSLIWIPNVVILLSISRYLSVFVLWSDFWQIATTGLAIFCVAWLSSAILPSVTISACLGLVPPLVALMGIGIFASPVHHGWCQNWYHGVFLSLSAVSFAGGTFYYLRRVEP